MSNQMNLPNTLNVISSPASAGGRSHSNLPGGPQLDLFGLEAAHASHSQPQAKDSEPQTNAISGPCSPSSLKPASLQQSLANRLRARLAGSGSPEYSLTWKEWDIRGQEPICALRASGHRTSVKDCSGWATPTCTEPDEQPEEKIARRKMLNERAKSLGKSGPGPALSLGAAVHLSGWPTPNVADINASRSNDPQAYSRRWLSRKDHGAQLAHTAQALAGWPTPKASEGSKDSRTLAGAEAEVARGKGPSLSSVSVMAGWPTPNTMDSLPPRDPETFHEWNNQRDGRKNRTAHSNLRQAVMDINQPIIAGWPTPSDDKANNAYGHKGTDFSDLPTTAQMAGWPTASSRDWKDTPGMATTGVNPDGSERTRLDQLPRVAALAGWPTPQVFDSTNNGEPRALRYKGNAPSEAGNTRNPNTPGSYRGDLKDYAGLAYGQTPSSSPAGTEKPAALNPQFTRWLMGFPPAWLSPKVLETLSSRKSRRSSSPPIST